MGVAFRDLSGPIFMDLVRELKELGESSSHPSSIVLSSS